MVKKPVKLPGLLCEPLPSGAVRYRVRVEGDKKRRVTLTTTPGDDSFLDEYKAARRGIASEAKSGPVAPDRSFAWLTFQFEASMQKRVDRGDMDPRTMKQRASFFKRLRADYGDYEMEMPRRAVVKIRDDMADTPGAANNCVKALRAMYAWALDQELVGTNPTDNVKALATAKSGEKGAKPWTVADLEQFRKVHQPGTTAHAALSIFMFTACRLDDAHNFGPANVVNIKGLEHLDWQPRKKGSARVTIPLMPPLKRAIEQLGTYESERWLLTGWNRPFASVNSFGNWFRLRVEEAGLSGLSPHGIRKAAGELMALQGATQYHIMAVHGHTQAKTSEIYTKNVNRQLLGREAMKTMAGFDW